MVTIGQITRRLRSTIALPIQFLLYLSAHFAERHAVGCEQQRFAIVQDAGKPCANSVRIKLDADFSGCVPIIRLSHGQLLMAVSERCGRQRRAGELAPFAHDVPRGMALLYLTRARYDRIPRLAHPYAGVLTRYRPPRRVRLVAI